MFDMVVLSTSGFAADSVACHITDRFYFWRKCIGTSIEINRKTSCTMYELTDEYIIFS